VDMGNDVPLIEMRNVSKSFGSVQALRSIDFALGRNEIVGLVGDNGAGKSTLINILSGIYEPDSGKIFVGGKPVRIASHKDATALGIETIYQAAALVGMMSVMRNMFLGRELHSRIGLLEKKEMNRITMDVLHETGISGIDSPGRQVAILSGGQRQAVAIARAVHFKSKVLLLDEPTSALSVKETQWVLNFILQLKEGGISSVFVTHNIHQVFSFADRFVILNRGEKVRDCRKEETCMEEIVRHIVS
jgi:simple sugar transport system ATP-binding protein